MTALVPAEEARIGPQKQQSLSGALKDGRQFAK